MQDTPSTLAGILDIEPPAMPLAYLGEQNLLGIIVATLILLCLIAASVHLFRQRYLSRRGRARHRLRLLQKDFDRSLLDSRDTAFQLAGILRDGLNLQQISLRTPLPDQHAAAQERWTTFIDRLAMTRYSRDEQTTTQIASLLVDARYWLKHWPKSTR